MAVNTRTYSVGDLKHSAILQNNTPVSDGAGGWLDNYATVLTTRCYLEKIGGGFSIQASAFNMDKRYRMIIRYQTALSVINTDSIWQIKSNTYRIIDHTKLDDTPHFYEFILQKQ